MADMTKLPEPKVDVAKDPETGVEKTIPARRVLRDRTNGSYWVEEDGFRTKLKYIGQLESLGLDVEVEKIYGNPEVRREAFEIPKELPSRTDIKWLSENGQVAKEFFRSKGLIVRQFGEGQWDWGVKARSEDPWRFVDPNGSGTGGIGKRLKEFAYDTLDILWDVGQGVASTAAGIGGFAVGGPVGSVGGAGTAGFGLEAARLEYGRRLGINPSTNLTQAAAVGAASAIPTPGMGRGGVRLKDLAADFAGEAGAMLTRAKPSGTLSAADVFAARVSDAADAPLPSGVRAAVGPSRMMVRLTPPREKMPSMAEQARELLKRARATFLEEKVDPTTGKKFMGTRKQPEFIAADKILEELDKKGETVSFDDIFRELTELTLPDDTIAYKEALKVKSQATGDPRTGVAKLLDDLALMVEKSGAKKDKIPLQTARELTSFVQRKAKSIGGLEDKLKDKVLVEVHEKIQGKMADAIEAVADAAQQQHGIPGERYSALMNRGHSNLSKLEIEMDKMGATLRNETEAEGKAIAYMLGLFGHRKSAQMDAVEELEKKYGVSLVPVARRGVVSTLIGDEGAMGVLPRITATGGVPLAVETGAGVLQSILGLSPRNIVKAGQFAKTISALGHPLAKGTVATLRNPATQASLQVAVQEAMRRMASGGVSPDEIP